MRKLFALILAVYGCLLFAAADGGSSRGERPEVKWGTPTGDYLERHGYILGRPGHYTPWVIYTLSKTKLVQKYTRDGLDFVADPDQGIEWRWNNKDYQASGFDRGHLFNAENASYDPFAMRDSFLLPNTCPQTPELNRGPMHAQENFERKLAEDADLITVVAGLAFIPDKHGKLEIKTIGEHRLFVPTHCWKALLIESNGELSVRGWMMENSSNPKPFDQCEVSVDAIEAAAGLDLFAGLPDDLEEKLER